MDAIGFRPLFLRNDFMFRSASFIGALEGGVVLLFEFFFSLSYFSSRLRDVRFSACIFSTLRHKFTFSVCFASMPHALMPSQKSVFSTLAKCP